MSAGQRSRLVASSTSEISSRAYDDSEESGPVYLRRLHDVYTRYSEAFTSDPCGHLCGAKLLYGQYAVVVQMPFFSGRNPSEKDLESGEVVEQVASALVWLARHGFVYTDLRLSNVIIKDADSKAVLIDYDDIKLCDNLITFQGLCRELGATPVELTKQPVWGSVWTEVERLFGPSVR